MEFAKLSAPSLKDLFVQQLQGMILSDELPMGTQLPPERELAQQMQVSRAVVNGGLSEEEKAQWQLFSNRAERLHDHVEMLREYLVQIRELYQSLIAVQQNQVMSILTVVTTIFLPLTLIAGWYGMNFPNMPEFGWKYAYPAVIIVSILVIILEIIYFKKKKML